MLAIYSRDELNNQFTEHSKDGEFTNPFAVTFNGSEGETVESKLFLRNDDDTKWYNNIVISAIPTDQIDETTGAIYKLRMIAQDAQPTANAWSSTPAGQALSTANSNAINSDTGIIGSTSAGDTAYHPFWVRIEVPANSREQINMNIKFQVVAVENTV